jgi:hypothetical protein
MDTFKDVDRACRKWLKERGIVCGSMREVIGNAVAERKKVK